MPQVKLCVWFSGLAIWDLDDAGAHRQNGFITDIRSLKQWGFWNSVAGRVLISKEEIHHSYLANGKSIPVIKIVGSTANKN
ncbi:MAG: hypothetical protein ACLRQF_22350 [Thomasclavelia ramosa]